MAIKAFFIECCEPFWIETVENLVHKHGFVPCYWTGLLRDKKVIKDKFPDVVYHDSFAAIRGIPPPETSHLKLVPLDESLLKDLSFYESVVLKMMDRMDPYDSFYYHERIRLYHFQVRYWSTILNHYNPNIVVFPYLPHIIFDYILYVLCQKRGIKTVVFQTCSVNGIIFPLERFEEETPAALLFRDLLRNYDGMPVALTESSEKHLKKIQGNYVQYVQSMAADTQNMILSNRHTGNCFYPKGKIALLRRYLSNIFGVVTGMYRPARLNYLKRKGKKIEDSKWTDLEYRLYKFKAGIKKHRLSVYYNKLAKKADLSLPYVYVPLHYQPECSSSPMGGMFAHQFIMIDLLSKSVPKSWHIYVKESFWQHNKQSHGERTERKVFYDDISRLKNVTLVPISIPQWELIDKAKAVATLTGTSGWEAVVRGTTALVFGYSWYKGCEGVFYTPTQESCKEALLEIEAGYKVDCEKVRLFVYAVEQAGFKGYVCSHYADVAGISYEDNIRALTDIILRIYGKVSVNDNCEAKEYERI